MNTEKNVSTGLNLKTLALQPINLFRKDFRRYLCLVFFLSVFIPIALVGSYINTSSSRLLEDNIYLANNEMIKRIEDSINIYIENMQKDMWSISQMAGVKNLDKTKMQSILLETQKGNPLLRNLFAADKTGQVVYNTSGLLYNVKSKDFFKSALNGYSSFSDVVISDINSKPIEIIYSVPIKVGKQIVGILAASLDLKSVSKIIEKIDTIRDHNTFIVDKRGRLIANKDWENIKDSNVYIGFKAVREAIEGKRDEGIFEYKGYKYLSVYSSMDTLGWYIITQMRYDIAFQDFIKQQRIFVLLMAATFILVLAAAFILSAYITRPITLMAKTMGSVSQGNLVISANEKLLNREDQFGRLAKSFNIMMDTIRSLTYYDALTSLPNLKLLRDRLSLELSHYKGTEKKMAVMFIDLDNFKNINDTLGHAIGDKLLNTLAVCLKAHIGHENIISRMSGDEFTLLFPEVIRKENVIIIAQELLEQVNRIHEIDGHKVRTTASIGISFYPDDGESEQALLKNADLAMYKAKEKGGNSFELYNPTMNSVLLEQVRLSNDMYHAFERNEFVLYYQPLVDIETKRIVGMEALIRWKHPELGLISPIKFIPISEGNGLIIPLGEWVLRTACTQARLWQNMGYTPGFISVNVSSQHFIQENFYRTVEQTLKDTGLDPKYLQIEITESVAMKDEEYTIKVFDELNALGISLALDDFGTGYSSLSYLTKFAFHTIKIDKSFVWNLAKNRNDEAIVSTIISIGNSLKLKVTAEGVESQEQFDFLRNHNCNLIQGYLFSPPVCASDMENLLDKQV